MDQASKIRFTPRRMFPRILVVLLALICVPILVSGALMMWTSVRAVRSSVLRMHQGIVQSAAGEIGRSMEGSVRILRLASHTVGEIRDDPWKVQTVLMHVCLEAPVFERIHFLSTEGRGIASSDLRPVPIPPEGRQVFEEAMHKRMFCRSRVSIQEGVPSVMLGRPVFHRGHAVGALVALINPRDMWELVDRIQMGEHSVAYVVSEEGVFLAHTDKRKVLRGEKLPEEEWAMIRSGPGDIIEFGDEAGDWIAGYALVPEVEWRVVLRQPREEAYRLLTGMTRTLLLILVVAVIAGVEAGPNGNGLRSEAQQIF